ncbi:MAG: SDR family NAD(P)-dependent oxidoreductase [Bacillota bacterium]
MDRKICLITGANSGIGKAACVQMLQKGYSVVMACRNEKRGRQALEDVIKQSGSNAAELLILDMSLQSSIKRAAQQYMAKYDTLDVLISNAAAFDMSQKELVKTPEGIESIWATNHLGPVLLVDELLEPLKKSGQGRIITVASQGLVMHPLLKVDIMDPEFEKRHFSVAKAYYQSKLAQVMYTYWLAEKLKDTGITVNCIRVTNVRVDVSRYPNISKAAKLAYSIKSKKSIAPEKMAETYVWLATAPELNTTTGKYFGHHNDNVNSSPYSRDEQQITALMERTYEYFKQRRNEVV